MTQNNKPEWFEITDKDEKPELRKVSKSLPVSAVLVTALILGIGAVVAQTQDQTPASAVVAIEQQSQPSQTTSAVTNPTTAAAVGVAAVGVAAVAGNKLANPAISQLPTGGDDDDDDHDGRGHDDDDEDDDEDEDDD